MAKGEEVGLEELGLERPKTHEEKVRYVGIFGVTYVTELLAGSKSLQAALRKRLSKHQIGVNVGQVVVLLDELVRCVAEMELAQEN